MESPPAAQPQEEESEGSGSAGNTEEDDQSDREQESDHSEESGQKQEDTHKEDQEDLNDEDENDRNVEDHAGSGDDADGGIEYDPSDQDENGAEAEPGTEETVTEGLQHQVLRAEIESGALYDDAGLPAPDLDPVISLCRDLLDRVPPTEWDRDEKYRVGDKDLIVDVEGDFPAGVKVVAGCVPFADKEKSPETVLAAVDIAFYDAEGNLYIPESEYTVTIGGKLVSDRIRKENPVLIYSYLENADRAKKRKEYSADVVVYRDGLSRDHWLYYRLGQNKDSVIYSEDLKGITTYTDNTLDFHAEGTPLHLLLTAQSREFERTLEATDGKSYKITVSYDESAGIPPYAELSVSEIRKGSDAYEDYVRQSADLTGRKEEELRFARAFDIRLTDPDSGEEYQPGENVRVRIELMDTSIEEETEVDVVHFGEEPATVDSSLKGETVTFDAEGFSVYVVIGGDGGTSSVPMCTYTFYIINEETGNYTEYPFTDDQGNTVFQQTVKKVGELIVPQPASTDTMQFAGWYEGNSDGSGGAALAGQPYDFENAQITEDSAVNLYAVYKEYSYVIFHGQYDSASGTFPVETTRRAVPETVTDEGTGQTSTAAVVKISDVSAPYTSSDGTRKKFSGWSLTPVSVPGAENDDQGNPVEQVQPDENGCISITETTPLYPIYKNAHWLTFYAARSGMGATYIAPVSYYEDENVPAPLPVPSREGYTFDGWYTGTLHSSEDGEKVLYGTKVTDGSGELVESNVEDEIDFSEGKLYLKSDVTLYAKWIANYRIVYWKQKKTETPGTAEITYDYAETVTRSAEIGATVSVAPEDCPQDKYTGYTYSHHDHSAQIADTKELTVLNVYYNLSPEYKPDTGEHNLRFVDSVQGEGASPSLTSENPTEGTPLAYTLAYMKPLKDYVPEDPVSGRRSKADKEIYTFAGWYMDKDCTISADLAEMTMPDHDLTLYAGWEPVKFLVEIDPNYGALATLNGAGRPVGSGSTYFNITYASEPIEEYTYVTRDYVESGSGDYFYVCHDLAYNGSDRYTYYTTEPGQATEDTTFVYEPGTYIYAGWYEVFADGSEADKPFDFTQHTDHDTKLRLHWRKKGTYYLGFDAGTGTLSGESGNTMVQDQGYADASSIILNTSADAPHESVFLGWQVRGSDSTRIYTPGQRFTLNADDAVSISGREIVYLDAVYAKIGTASIVYDANGGAVNDSVVDYGSTMNASGTSPASGVVNPDAGTASVAGLSNNGRFILSNGNGFSCTRGGTELALKGWSDRKVYDPADPDAKLLLPGETYRVDTAEPVTLYAVWETPVIWHLNNEDASWGEGWDDALYPLGNPSNTRSSRAVLGGTVAEPDPVPVCAEDNRLFLYWTAAADSTEAYDFSSQVEGPLDLYACWSDPNTIRVHAVDASAEDLAEVTETEGWTVTNARAKNKETSLDDDSHVQAPDRYTFAFAAVSEDLDSVSEENAVKKIKYDSKKKSVCVQYEGSSAFDVLENGKELYFVYYKEKALDIKYVSMTTGGVLSEATVDGSAPESTGTVSPEGYDMASLIDDPLNLASGENDYTHYAFAIGTKNAENASGLHLITKSADEYASEPALQVRSSWRGFEYTTDGSSWAECGYDPCLYVVYYQQEPTVITLREQTCGTRAVLDTEFTYAVNITQTVTGGQEGAETTTLFTGSYALRDAEEQSMVLFADSRTTQTIAITQQAANGFDTQVDAADGETTQPYTWTYTHSPESEADTQLVTFRNTHSAQPVEVHTAIVENNGDAGAILRRDTLRTEETAKYSISLAPGTSKNLLAELPEGEVFTGDREKYAFLTVLCGSGAREDGGAVTVDAMGVATVSYEQIEGTNVYELVLRDGDGKKAGTVQEGVSEIYYLYYPMPEIRYVKEDAAGNLTPITGSLPDPETGVIVANEALTYNHRTFTMNMNEKTVAQGDHLEIPAEGLRIRQRGSGFHMPPIMDDGLYERYLSYVRIGTGPAGADNVSALGGRVSDGLSMWLQIRDSALQYSFDEKTWADLPLAGTPTIYAIYQERGYDLQIRKTVDTSDSGENAVFEEAEFTVTLQSDAITKESYAAEGAAEVSVSATPAAGSTPGSIVLTVKDGSKIRLKGLTRGTYTVTETQNDNYLLSAGKGRITGNTTNNVVEVSGNSRMTLTLDSETRLDLVNTPRPLCKIRHKGTDHIFFTLRSAVAYVTTKNMSEGTAVIEMLTDYVMPAADTMEVPAGYEITLKTADSGFSGRGSLAVISRSSAVDEVPMFTNMGSMTIRNLVVDGKQVKASAPAIRSEGDLTIGAGATVQNAVQSGDGGAIYASGGNLTINSGTLKNNSAANGGSVYYAGSGTISMTGTATIQGSSASAGDGGAVYAAGGTIRIAGTPKNGTSTLGNNSAPNGRGGAVYAAAAVITIEENGTLTDNKAQSGGAVYVGTGTITVQTTEGVTPPVLEKNEATTGDGGAIYLASGTVSLQGGSLTDNHAKNGNGGAVAAEQASVTVSGTAQITSNRAGTGGAIHSGSGAVNVTGGSLSNNTALTGNGGAIHADRGQVTVSGGSMSQNAAAEGSGGAVYADRGSVNISAGAGITGNSAKQNGGAVCAGSGSVTLSGVSLTQNTAESGNGGAVYAGSGSVNVSGGSMQGNAAANGAALFVNTGSAVFAGTDQAAVEITGNTASQGGAVGVGDPDVRLTFSGNVQITGNTMGTGGEAVPANVCLDRDVDTVIRSNGLSESASIGVYVAGAFDSEVFQNRGVAGSRFGSYQNDANLAKFTNDRTPSLKAGVGANNKIIWVCPLQVQARYVASFANGFPPSVQGSLVYPASGYASYDPPSDENGVSVIASDFYSNFSSAYPHAGFACAFAETDTEFDQYLTDVNWDPETGSWVFVRNDGNRVEGEDAKKLVLYFSDPSYINIENNTTAPLELSGLTVGGRSVAGNDTSAGYGYVVAVNGVTQPSLRPVTAQNLSLAPGKSVRLLIPGAGGMEYTIGGSFTGAAEAIRLRRTEEAEESLSAEDANSGFSRTGQMAAESGASTEIIFGGDKPICRIVTDTIENVNDNEIAGSADAGDGKKEYVFRTLNQAVDFVQAHMSATRTAQIELLVDYLMPRSDAVIIPKGYDLTFTTALGGTYHYDGDRATISRDPGNLVSFFLAGGTYRADKVIKDEAQDYGTVLTVNNLNFDGKALVGKGDGGAIMAINTKVTVENADFSNFTAGNGGAVYVVYTTPNNSSYLVKNEERLSFTASGVNFTNCVSSSTDNRQGGGAVWTNARTFVLRGDGETTGFFESCSAFDQGGAVFHCIEPGYAENTSTTISGCSFQNCEARAAGAVESDAANVEAENCSFAHCKANMRNGGAFNIWSRGAGDSTAPCTVTVTGCTFEDCHADNTSQDYYGGGLRSTAVDTIVTDCSFHNTSSIHGGAIAISNLNAKTGRIQGCTISASTATRQGGGIYCTAPELTIEDYVVDGETPVHTSISGATAGREGGGVCHRTEAVNSALVMTNVSVSGCKATGTNRDGGGVYSSCKSAVLTGCTLQGNTAARYGGGIWFSNSKEANRTDMTMQVSGCTISGNTAGNRGGGIYATAISLETSDGTILSGNTAVNGGGGIWQDLSKSDQSVTILADTEISGCSTTGDSSNGGGIYINTAKLEMTDCMAKNNTAAESGGGIYSYAKDFSLTRCEVQDNTAGGKGGGLYDGNGNAEMLLDTCTITGNSAGGQGGGVFANSNSTLCNTEITGNRLTTAQAENAAGMWLPNWKKLTIGSVTTEEADATRITGNTAGSGAASNLRLSESNNVNTNCVTVNCSLSGSIGVVNAKKQGTQFGTSPNTTDTWRPEGLSDSNHVFTADDGTLYGMIERLDTTGKKIIWAGPPICKITDAEGRLLYFKVSNDSTVLLPAIFDQLDNGTANAANTGAFSLLKNTKANLRLFYAGGTTAVPDSGPAVYCVKMLVDAYTAGNNINMNPANAVQSNSPWMKIVFCTETRTEATEEDPYPYRGRPGTRCTVTRGQSIPAEKPLVAAAVSFTLEDIVLDGGGILTTAPGALVSVKGNNNNNYRYVTIDLGQNSTLQNAETSGNGGAVYFDYGNLVLNGGTIRNCRAGEDGGGIYMSSMYKTGPVRGYMNFNGGTIDQCTATRGGGVYQGNNGLFTMSGGTISRCQAGQGGGLYIANNAMTGPFNMSGGFIINNHATTKGGGIAFAANDNIRINFSGKPDVSGNTADKGGSSVACNVELDRDTNNIINTNQGGLLPGAYIGVYVPDGTTLYDKHGIEKKPFGKFANGDNTSNLYSFVNDRNGLKGGIIENPDSNTIYWIQIFSLQVRKSVEAGGSAQPEENEEFSFTVNITGNATSAAQKNAWEIDSRSGEYGQMYFISNERDMTSASFTLHADEAITGINLSQGLTYEVAENLTEDQARRYCVLPTAVRRGMIGENRGRTDVDPYTSVVEFTNMLPVCKITDYSGALLFRKYTIGTGENQTTWYVPAVYTELTGENGAFAALQGTLYTAESGYSVHYAVSNGVQIQMLIPEYTLPEAAVLPASVNGEVTLTTASAAAERFPYQGTGTGPAVIRRGYDGGSMFTVGGRLTLRTISLDGAKGSFAADADGGIALVQNGGTLKVESGAALENSRTTQRGGAVFAQAGAALAMSGGAVRSNESAGDGAGIYLEQTSRLRLSGSPDFGGTGLDIADNIVNDKGNLKDGTLVGKNNGGKTYEHARQDIFLAEAEESPASLILEGNLTGDPGSIWVWAAEQVHYETMKPFARLDPAPGTGTISGASYAVFRNARPDTETLCPGDTYLSGSSGENPDWIYWSGGFDVLFRKVDGFGNALPDAEFGLYTDPACEETDAYTAGGEAVRVRSADGTDQYQDRTGTTLPKGTVLFENVPAGIYYLKETAAPTKDPDGKDMRYTNDSIYMLLLGQAAFENAGTGTLSEITRTQIDEQAALYKTRFQTASDYAIFRMEEETSTDGNAASGESSRAAAVPDLAKYGMMNLSVPSRIAIFKKNDGTDYAPLSGASFEILRYDRTPVKDGSVESFQSGDNGVFRAGTLPYGIYYLHETAAPAGYPDGGDDGWWFTMRVDLNGVEILSREDTEPLAP
ncbi:MAG: SpaA isopeptide-forming pilin-related protein [Eubacteriales bacterium]|nr:SpaA isopeptide-forming pilin-related protein [Eubacteriales bacterium]